MKLYRRKIPTPRFALINITKQGNATIILRVNLYGTRVGFSTGIHIPVKHWDKKRQRAKLIRGKEDEYSDINSRLNGFSELAQAIIKENQDPLLTPDQFKTLMADRSGKTETYNPSTLFPFIEDYIKRRKEDPTAKYNTVKKFPVSLMHLKNFAKELGKNDFTFNEIDWEFREKYLNWLYSPPRNHSQATARKEIKNLKNFMAEAEKRGLHENRIYAQRGFGVKASKTKNKVRLTFDELEALADLDLKDTPRLERVRDLFLVGCYTGTRVSDWHKVRRENILSTPDGDLLQIVAKKVEDQVIIPVFPILKGILEKYNYQLPPISDQKINDYIKEVGELAIPNSTFQRIYSEGGRIETEIVEKWKRISTHAARRSFASNFWEAGISAATLMQITGHTTEKQFFEYIDVSKEQAARQFAKMALEVLKKRE